MKKYLLFVAGLLTLGVTAQTYSFTPCGATGNTGPTQTQANTTYSNTNLQNNVTINPQGIQNWTVPVTSVYNITAIGANGYGQFAGRGARISGDFTLTAGTVLKILVGQAGILPSNTSYNAQYGGGGGSFVTYTNNTPLVVAGGGGGSWAQSYTGLSDGTVSASGNTASNGPTNGAGGTLGGGGGAGGSACGGGGISGSGSGTGGGLAFTSGGTGGSNYGVGGFGGGGGTDSFNNRRGGGGGGYSGGGGAGSTTTGYPEGGGGGSINGGANQTNTSGFNLAGDGVVIITAKCSVSITSTGAFSLTPSICSGNTVTLTANSASLNSFSWSTGANGNNIAVAPTSNTSYTVMGTSSTCTAFAVVTVSVNTSAPTLTITSSSASVCLGKTATLSAAGAVNYTWTGGISNGVSFTPTITSNYTVTGSNGCGNSTSVTSISVAPLPVGIVASNTNVCAGSASSFSVISTGNSFTWAPGNFTTNFSTYAASPTVATVYTVSVSDGTCSGNSSINISVSPIPTIGLSVTNTNVCVGETFTANATGGNSYTWMPINQTGTLISLSITSPTLLVVTGNNQFGCTASAQQIILVKATPQISGSVSSTLVCSGSAVNLIASGSADTYTWNGQTPGASVTINPITNSTYSVTGTNTTTGCQSSATTAVNVITTSVSITSPSAICAGESATLTGNGADAYLWDNGSPFNSIIITPSATAVYSVTGTTSTLNLTCQSSASIQLVVNQNPTVTATAARTVMCKGETQIITATGASTYSWSNGANTSTISITPSVSTIQNMTVVGTSSLNCSAKATVIVNVQACNTLAENNTTHLSVFPNPTHHLINIQSEKAIHVKLMNQMGQVVYTADLQEGITTIDLSSIAKGLYFLSAEGTTGTELHKVIID
jgi:hypothetical protein